MDKIVAGTIYPLLQKIRKQGVIHGEMRPSPDGPDRKYFSLSDAGREGLEEFLGPVAGASHKSRTYQEGGRRMVESYTEKMSDELIHLNKEDQAYVKKKWWPILGPNPIL